MRLNERQYIDYQYGVGIPRRVAASEFKRAMDGEEGFVVQQNKLKEWCVVLTKPEEEDWADRHVQRGSDAPSKTGGTKSIASFGAKKATRANMRAFFGDAPSPVVPIPFPKRSASPSKPGAHDAESHSGGCWDSWWGSEGWQWGSDAGWDNSSWGAGEQRPQTETPAQPSPRPAPSEPGSTGEVKRRRRGKGEPEALPDFDTAMDTFKSGEDVLSLPLEVWYQQQAARSIAKHIVSTFKVVKNEVLIKQINKLINNNELT